MMSEEEPKFMQHHASWKSQCFVTKLENRFIKSHSAKPRMYGSSIDRPFPAGIPTWMKGTYGSKGNYMSPENDERVAYGSVRSCFTGVAFLKVVMLNHTNIWTCAKQFVICCTLDSYYDCC